MPRPLACLLPLLILGCGAAVPQRSSIQSAAEASIPATQYAVDTDQALWVSTNHGETWRRSDRADAASRVTAIATDPADPSRVIVAEGYRVFESTDAGESFTELDLGGVVNPATYITALAIGPDDPETIVAGTSYDGLYASTDGGQSWYDVTLQYRLRPLHLGGGFLEEIGGLELESGSRTLTVWLSFGMGVYEIDLDSGEIARIAPGARWPRTIGRYPHIGVHAAGITTAGARGPATLAAADPNLDLFATLERRRTPPRRADLDQAAAARRDLARNRRGIYLSPYRAAELETYIDYLHQKQLNSIVVDFKDDLGRLTYDSELELPTQIGAVDPIFDAQELIETAHGEDLYVIARIVVFKDRELYDYQDNRYALWDSVRDRPWGVFRLVTPEPEEPAVVSDDAGAGDAAVGAAQTTGDADGDDARQEPVPYYVQTEHWVDPYSTDVWRYNIEIARELAELGVDEIQFDYIRFPSDGDTSTVLARFRPERGERVHALEGFLAQARSEIDLPISIDVFGFNGWSRMTYLGQDISVLAKHVDVISPMYYPSHFDRAFLPWFDYLDRARYIYEEGSRRAVALSEGRAIIRPYAQAFLLWHELEYDEPTYLRYLQLQLDGIEAGPGDGFTLWNASGRYYMYP